MPKKILGDCEQTMLYILVPNPADVKQKRRPAASATPERRTFLLTSPINIW
jgi:hypothetical protein